jgi:hypothetical protein
MMVLLELKFVAPPDALDIAVIARSPIDGRCMWPYWPLWVIPNALAPDVVAAVCNIGRVGAAATEAVMTRATSSAPNSDQIQLVVPDLAVLCAVGSLSLGSLAGVSWKCRGCVCSREGA